jgi:hypothetical protein
LIHVKNLIIFVINIHTGGREMSEQEKASIDEAVEHAREFLAEKRKPKKWNQEQKERQSARLARYYKEHPEKRAELSKRIQASWTKERRKAFSKIMKRVLARKEVRDKISEGVKRHWDSYRKWKEGTQKDE